MKRSLLYSIILHVLLLSIAFFFIQEKKDKSPPPFFARIITPDELKEGQGKELVRPPKGAVAPPRVTPPRATERRRGGQPPRFAEKSSPPKQAPDVEPVPPPVRSPNVLPRPETFQGQTAPPMTPSASRPGSEGELLAKSQPPAGAPPGVRPRTAKEKLFDRDVIAKLAERNKEDLKPESGITFDTKEFKYYGYLQRLKEKIEGIWLYPKDAADKGIYGDLYIRFTIRKNGKLGAVELVRTSGYKSLDDAAIKALRDADPFWPLPEEWGRDGFTITGHFVYSLHGIYIR